MGRSIPYSVKRGLSLGPVWNAAFPEIVQGSPFLVIRLSTLQLYFLSLLVLPMSGLGDKSLAASDLLDEFNDYEVLTQGRPRGAWLLLPICAGKYP
tara:strand:- start:8362 stop:8649 length:288 start_codon:yes stop_codon:yes gene_type:complete